MRIIPFFILCTFVLTFSPALESQSLETGAILGTVVGEEGNPLSGATVILSSASMVRKKKILTDEEGKYRFGGLPPGNYEMRAEFPGCLPLIRKNIQVRLNISLTVDLRLKPIRLNEESIIQNKAPLLDVISTETSSVTIDSELLSHIPHSQLTPEIVNTAPGVVDEVSMGATQSTGISYRLEGVDVSDPEDGSSWVFLDYHIIEEAKVMGPGLSAPFGSFSGTVFNLVTQRGGSEWAGSLGMLYQGKRNDWPWGVWGTWNNRDYIQDFPYLNTQHKLWDIYSHLGGSIKKESIWFFTGFQWYRTWDYPKSFPEPQRVRQPRVFMKVISHPIPRTRLNTFLEYGGYLGSYMGAASDVHPQATLSQEKAHYVGNISVFHSLPGENFLDLKAAFFSGYDYLDPKAGDKSAHYQKDKHRLYESAGYFQYANRARYQVNASLSHHTEDFLKGGHDFKFGVEYEHGRARNRFGYTGPHHLYYLDLVGYGPFGFHYEGNFEAVQYQGYETRTFYNRAEAFFHDTWNLFPRFHLSVGSRFVHNRGAVREKGNVYNTFQWTPRIGFTFDVLGDHSTALKAHYGKYAEAMYTGIHECLNPMSAYSDKIYFYWNVRDKEWVEYYRKVHEDLYRMDDEIHHPYMEQFVFSLERQLFKKTSLKAALIIRDWENFIIPYDRAAQYFSTTVYDQENGESYSVYSQVNPGEHAFVLSNAQKGDPWILNNPSRNYWGIQFTFRKRFSHHWQLMASYTYSETKGTIDNRRGDDIGMAGNSSRRPWHPNYWMNAYGNCSGDPTHSFKILGSYQFPWGIHLNASFQARNGGAWTRSHAVRLAQGWREILTEPRGSHHYPMKIILDLRVEKSWVVAQKYRLRVMMDVFNVFNTSTVEKWGTTMNWDFIPGKWPSTEGHKLYSLTSPRQLRLGLRFMF